MCVDSKDIFGNERMCQRVKNEKGESVVGTGKKLRMKKRKVGRRKRGEGTTQKKE